MYVHQLAIHVHIWTIVIEIVLLVIIEGMMANVDGMFNLTATYEDDADIWLPYGFYSKRSKPLDDYLPAQKNR